jgi:hypothetical protein
MDYHRVGYTQSPIRPMGMGSSPDGLGAYFQTSYTQPIRPAPARGSSIVADYHPISGLGAYFQTSYTQPIRPAPAGGSSIIADFHPLSGCLPCMAAAAGYGADAPAPSLLSNFWVRAAFGVGAVALAWYTVPAFRKLWGPSGALVKNKSRRRNARRRLRF